MHSNRGSPWYGFSLPLHSRFESLRPEMHGMPETVRATPPSLSICGWIALTASTCATGNVRDKVLGAVARLSPQAKSVVRSRRRLLCVLFFSLHPCKLRACYFSLSLSSLHHLLCSALSYSELLMRVRVRYGTVRSITTGQDSSSRRLAGESRPL